MKKQANDYDHIMATGIILYVALVLNVKVSELLGKVRRAEVLEARQLAIYIVAQVLPDTSQSQIGRYFGGLEHATVAHAIHKVEDMLTVGDYSFCEKYSVLMLKLDSFTQSRKGTN